MEAHGHLHAFLDSGAEAKLCKGDVRVTDTTVTVDSKDGYWVFPVDKVENVDVEPSTVYQAE